MILVTGATGSIGEHVVRQLAARGAAFTALVRDRGRGARLGCPLAVGDFDAPDTLRAALEGAERVLLNGSVDEGMARRQKAVIDAARAAGVAQIVRVSAAGTSAESDRAIHRWHAEIDEHLAASGVAWSLLQPTYFMQNLLGSAASIRATGKLHGAFRDGRLAAIDCADIAACAAVLLTAPIRSGDAFVLTGREAFSFGDVAASLSAKLGKHVEYVDHPPGELVASMLSRGMAPTIAESFGKMMEAFASGGASLITSGVEHVTGREARSFDEFLTDNLDAFR